MNIGPARSLDHHRRAHVPIRIYALAKDLEVDSKDLVDICTKAGITGKGSALASLSDDEADKVKAFLRGSTAAGSVSATVGADVSRGGGGLKVGRGGGGLLSRGKSDVSTAVPFTREDYIGPTGYGAKIKVIDTRRTGAGKGEEQKETPEVQVEPVSVPPTTAPEPPWTEPGLVVAESATAPRRRSRARLMCCRTNWL